jgi:alkylhydroperoxidase family enzyme
LARRLGGTDEQLAALARGEHAALAPGWTAALRYAEAITPGRGHAGDPLFEEMVLHWTVSQIVEITAVIAAFNYFNRFAEALRVPVTR